jgi:hypothetical protein
MKKRSEKASRKRSSPSPQPSRREFLKLSAFGAVAAAGAPAMAERLSKAESNASAVGAGNRMPGRIVMLRDPNMNGHLSTINRDLTESNVHFAVCMLTGIPDTGEAFEYLFPDVVDDPNVTFAIKVNCIGPTCTRWEVARGVVSGLSLMRGGTYDVSQVTIYDRHNLHNYGYDESEFTFSGNYPLISHTNNASGSGYYVWESHELSRYILNSTYVINIPALKSHSNGNNQITVALKNHYGSCQSAALCGDIPGMLALNSDAYVKDKTGLVLTDALRGTYYGGPGEAPHSWLNYPEGSPNTIFATTDPVTNEYWARDTINSERDAHDWSLKPCPWVEEASEPSYDIGVSDPGEMTVLDLDTSDVPRDPRTFAGGVLLAPNVPNPFRDSTTLRFYLADPGRAALRITDVSGRLVRDLAGREYPQGWSEVQWDGRDSRGRKAAPGVYVAGIEANGRTHARRMIVAR